jgi:hypothetical protein
MLSVHNKLGWKRELMRKVWLTIRDIRCLYLFTFKPEYVNEQIKSRKGHCPPDCGLCCRFVSATACKHLKNNRCAIYKTRTQNCRDSPIDRFDLWITERFFDGRCKLYWGDDPAA